MGQSIGWKDPFKKIAIEQSEYETKKTTLDGKEAVKFKCPDCKTWGLIDDDQLNGRVSILCECGFHKTINLWEKLKK